MILITGGTGLVGSYLLMFLTGKGERVKATFRRKEGQEDSRRIFEAYGNENNFELIDWIETDILDIHSLEHALKDVEYIYHCAALVSFEPSERKNMMNINIDGTSNIVNLALEMGIKKLCYVSSVAAIGEENHPNCSNENSDWHKTKHSSNYSISKHYAENEVWRASEEGLPVVIVNPSLILGYGNWNKGSLSIIRKVNKGLSYYPPGANSFVGVEDVSKIMIKLMESDISAERFILTSENLSYKELLDEVAVAFGKSKTSKKAPLSIGRAMVFLDSGRKLLFGKSRLLTKESLNSSFHKKCYSNEKVTKKLGYQFQSMKEVLKGSAEKFKHFPID